MEMNARRVSYVLGFLSSLLVAVSISAISQLPSRYAFSVLFGILTFFIYLLLIKNWTWQIKFKSIDLHFKSNFHVSKDFSVLVLYAVSIILVLLIPSNTESQFVAWTHIPILNYVRLFAGLLLSSILPGYGLLRLIDRKNRFNGLNLVVFSFFTSVFAATFLSCALMVLNVPIENTFWAMLILNLIVLSLNSFAFITNISKENFIKKEEKTRHNFDYLILACIFCFFIIGWVIYYSSYSLGSKGDMWTHYGTYLQLSKGVNIFSASHLAYFGAETWLPLHYFVVSLLTGFPAINGWMVYAFINFFYILAIYQAVRGIVGVNHPKIPVIATVIATLFAGFGWVHALSLSSSNNWLTALNTAGRMTYNDIANTFLYGPIPQYFSLAVLFSLLYLMVRKSKFDVPSAFLTVILVAVGFLVHSPEIIMLPIFYYCYLFFVSPEEFGRLRKYSLSILIGLLVVFIVGLPFPNHFYSAAEQPLLFLFLMVSLTFVLIHFRAKFSHSFAFSKRLGIVLVGSVWVLYILSFFAWNYTLNLGVTANLVSVGLKPWYIYPVASGISLLLGLLGLTCLIVWRKFKLENAKFLIFSVLAFFVAGVLLSYANINISATGYWEKRLYTFMILPLSVLGAFFIAEVIPKLTFGKFAKEFRIPAIKYVIIGLLISLIVISGVSSNILALDRTTLVSQGDPYAAVSKAELQALDFLRTNASADATVLGLSTASNRLAYVFSGMNHLNSPYWFTSNPSFQFVDITTPELALKMLYSLNITYLFATKSDLQTLGSSGYVVNHLLNYLPIAYQNSEVTVYRVPKLNPPSSDSNLTVTVPSYMFDALSNQSILLQNLPQQPIFNETFEYITETSAAWTVVNGTWSISNGVYTGNQRTWIISPSLISGYTFSDFSIKTDFKILSGTYAGITFRNIDASNYYAALISADGKNNDLYRVVDGKYVIIKHSAGSSIIGAWSTLEVKAYGNQIIVYLNGELILSASDSLFTSGKVGLLVDASTASFDNVVITQFPDVGSMVDYVFYLPIDMMAQSGLDYSIKNNDDGSLFNSDYILLPSDKGWSDEQINNYLAWVNNGGHLIVLNSNGLGDFSEILSIGSKSGGFSASGATGASGNVELGDLHVTPLFSNDAQIKVVASYIDQNNQSSPLAFSKSVGNGNIIYLNIGSMFEDVYSDTLNSTSFSKLGQLFNLLNLDSATFQDIPVNDRYKYMLYDTTWVRDYLYLQGAVRSISNCTIFPYNLVTVGQLEIVNATGTVNGLSMRDLSLKSVTLKDIVESSTIHSTIDTEGMYILSSNYGSYSFSFVEPSFNASFQIIDGSFDFTVTRNNEVYVISVESGTINLKGVATSQSELNSSLGITYPENITISDKTLLLQRTPAVTVTEVAYLSEAYVPNYIINNVNGYPLQINGTIHFNFDCSSDNVILLTNFGYSGTFQTGRETTRISMTYWELTAIPWASILSSALFLVFCILLAMIALTIYSTYSKASGKKELTFTD